MSIKNQTSGFHPGSLRMKKICPIATPFRCALPFTSGGDCSSFDDCIIALDIDNEKLYNIMDT